MAWPGGEPVWEPCLLVANHKLICYYSDERDPNHGQKLVHQTTTDGIHWSSVVNDVALTDKTQRPGMAVVSRMPNGNYIMTYEIVGIGGAYYQISSDPEKWNVTSTGTKFGNSGCPYNCVLNNENTSPQNISDWKLVLDGKDISISSIWCANKSLEDSEIILTPETYNASINADSATIFGFGGNGKLPASLHYKLSYKQNGAWKSVTDSIILA